MGPAQSGVQIFVQVGRLARARRGVDMAASKNAGWDIGENPTVRMAYLEYPIYAKRDPTKSDAYVLPPTVCRRDENEIFRKQPFERGSEEEQARLAVRNVTGWASDRREVYKPLGIAEELPATGPELRVRKMADYSKPRVVLPTAKVKRKGKEDEDELGRLLTLGEPLTGRVNQFSYTYFRFELTQPQNLVFNLRMLEGDPDMFVSNEVEQPKLESNEHTWRESAAGDDELTISIDHPKYTLGWYYIGVYSVQDSEFELVASLVEPPTKISLQFDERTQDNGYSTLAGLVATAESRRRACLFGTAARAEKPQPKDMTRLFKALPPHLKTALTPETQANKGGEGGAKGASAGAPPGSGGGASATSPRVGEPALPSPTVRSPSLRHMGGSGRLPGGTPGGPAAVGAAPAAGASGAATGAATAPPVIDAPPHLPFITNAYLVDACFGSAMAPLRGSQIASQPGAATAAVEAAAAAAAALTTMGSLMAPNQSDLTNPLKLSPPSSPVAHPWLPSGLEPSKQSEVAKQVSRAPMDLKPTVLKVRHCAMKGDMDTQMRRIAGGLEAERDLILHFKSRALNNALDASSADKASGALPLTGNVVDAFRAIRQSADGMRQDTLKELVEVAEKEAAKAAEPSTEGKKSPFLRYAPPAPPTTSGTLTSTARGMVLTCSLLRFSLRRVKSKLGAISAFEQVLRRSRDGSKEEMVMPGGRRMSVRRGSIGRPSAEQLVALAALADKSGAAGGGALMRRSSIRPSGEGLDPAMLMAAAGAGQRRGSISALDAAARRGSSLTFAVDTSQTPVGASGNDRGSFARRKSIGRASAEHLPFIGRRSVESTTGYAGEEERKSMAEMLEDARYRRGERAAARDAEESFARRRSVQMMQNAEELARTTPAVEGVYAGGGRAALSTSYPVSLPMLSPRPPPHPAARGAPRGSAVAMPAGASSVMPAVPPPAPVSTTDGGDGGALPSARSGGGSPGSQLPSARSGGGSPGSQLAAGESKGGSPSGVSRSSHSKSPSPTRPSPAPPSVSMESARYARPGPRTKKFSKSKRPVNRVDGVTRMGGAEGAWEGDGGGFLGVAPPLA